MDLPLSEMISGVSLALLIVASFLSIVASMFTAGSSGGMGKCASDDVSLLGASISSVTTLGLKGQIPVFLKASGSIFP